LNKLEYFLFLLTAIDLNFEQGAHTFGEGFVTKGEASCPVFEASTLLGVKVVVLR